MNLPHFDVWHLALLLLVCVLAAGWLVDGLRCRTRLRWAELRADTNGGAISAVCQAFEGEGYQCDVSTIPTDYGDFYAGVNVIRPTDSSFYVTLPGDRYSKHSIHLRNS